ncbi:hypothetical protein ACLOJK_014611 [Asimina triloba]
MEKIEELESDFGELVGQRRRRKAGSAAGAETERGSDRGRRGTRRQRRKEGSVVEGRQKGAPIVGGEEPIAGEEKEGGQCYRAKIERGFDRGRRGSPRRRGEGRRAKRKPSLDGKGLRLRA